jgi:hypothetical protein
MLRTSLGPALCALGLSVLTGCGGSGKTVWVTGKLVKGGNKYTAPVNQKVSLTFVTLALKDASDKRAPTQDSYSADVDQEKGSFTVPGPLGEGIPPGKYRVAVTQTWTREGLKNAPVEKGKRPPGRETDLLRGRLNSENSRIDRTVDASSSDLTIDLDQPGG